MHDDSDLKALKKKWREAAAWRDVLTSISSLAPVSVFSGSFHRVFNYAPLFWPPMDHRRNTNYRVTKRWFTLPNFLIPILNGFHPRQNILFSSHLWGKTTQHWHLQLGKHVWWCTWILGQRPPQWDFFSFMDGWRFDFIFVLILGGNLLTLYWGTIFWTLLRRMGKAEIQVES